MEQPKIPPPVPKTQVVKITLDEANSSHVDDLLQRQAAMRGERGMAAPRGRRRWYYQNWFLFMIAAGVAAFGAWALMEPFFDDQFYFQGIVAFESIAQSAPIESQGKWATVNGQPIFIPEKAL